jgi:ABC-type glycerol-3-phosphate transport system substrate-binding protein
MVGNVSRSRVGHGRLLAALLGAIVVLAAGCGSQTAGNSQGADGASGTVVSMAYPGYFEGLTAQASAGSNSAASFYTYYHSVWANQLPHLHITENDVSDEPTEITKTLLEENAGDPPDLISFDTALPQLVQRGAVMNLDPYFKAAGITPSDFLPGLASYSRYDGHWYGMPMMSNPTADDLVTIPKYLSAAGVSPNQPPKTWSQLWQESQKVTRFGPGHSLERIGEAVGGPRWDLMDLYCGYPAVWNAQTGYHADPPCIQSYFKYEMQLVDLYGGWSTYSKFNAGDPGYWNCSPTDYVATGKILFDIDAYWGGGQLDHCYDLTWKLSQAPSQTGALNKGIVTTAGEMAIPKGAKDPQAAFDLWLVTFYKYGYLDGPTTNGYIRTPAITAWNKQLVTAQAKIREKNHYPGNPMAEAVNVMSSEAKGAEAAYPRGAFTAQYITIMTDAWNKMVYSNVSVDQALRQAQQQVNTQEHDTPGGVLAQ